MNTAAIETIGLGRDYGSTTALDALDLVVPAGAIVGLLGPNGAGKTTTMLLLATLLRPSRGVARLFGQDVTRTHTGIRRRLEQQGKILAPISGDDAVGPRRLDLGDIGREVRDLEEGVQLIAVYLIIALMFYVLPV